MVEAILNIPPPDPRKDKLKSDGPSLDEVYREAGLLADNELLRVINIIDALHKVQELPHVFKFIKQKLVAQYAEVSHKGYPPAEWPPLRDRIADIYLRSLFSGDIHVRELPLLTVHGQEIQSEFMKAYGITQILEPQPEERAK